MELLPLRRKRPSWVQQTGSKLPYPILQHQKEQVPRRPISQSKLTQKQINTYGQQHPFHSHKGITLKGHFGVATKLSHDWTWTSRLHPRTFTKILLRSGMSVSYLSKRPWIQSKNVEAQREQMGQGTDNKLTFPYFEGTRTPIRHQVHHRNNFLWIFCPLTLECISPLYLTTASLGLFSSSSIPLSI